VTRMLTDMREAEWVYFTDEASLVEGLAARLGRETASS